MKMPYAGKTTFFKYFIEAENIREIILNTLSTYVYLTFSIEKLYEKEVIHYDLKGENIMYNTNKDTPIIIDFGLSIHIPSIKTYDDLNDKFYVYAPDYYLWCPEIQYLSYLATIEKYPDEETIKRIASEIVEMNTPLHNICSKSFIKKYKSSLTSFLLTFLHMKPMDVFKKMRQYMFSWDNYSIAIMYMRILYYLYRDGFTDNDFILFFMKLLLQNIHPNPTRRFDCRQSIYLFNNYSFKKKYADANDYSQLFKNMVSNRKEIQSLITQDENKLNSILKKKQVKL